MKFSPLPALIAAAVAELFCDAMAVAAAKAGDGGKPPTFLEAHCTDCHDAADKKGGLDLTAMKWEPVKRENFDEWVKVVDRVRSGEMPPKKKPRPDAAALKNFVNTLDNALHDFDAKREAANGRTVLRRLNRMEYENAMHDLLGITTPLAGILPEDTPMHGFDTVAEGLRFSQLQMEKYLEAADAALDDAINLNSEPEHVSKRYLFKDEQDVRKNLDTPVGTVTDKFNPKQTHRHLMRELPDAIVFFNEGYPPAQLRQFFPRGAGVFRFRISGYGYQSEGRAIPMRVYADNFREKRFLGWFEMTADKPRVVELVAALKNNEHLLIEPTDTGVDKKGQGLYNIGAEAFTGAGLALQWVEVEGPLAESWPPPSVKKVFGDTPLTDVPKNKRRRMNNREIAYELSPADAKATAKQVIENFAARAFRRPLESGGADRLVKLATDELDAGVTFTDAVRVSLRGVLTSPQFLLFDEKPGRLDDFALASRLSFFLWSTMPDNELLKLAAQKKFAQPATFRAQVQRMLKDRRAHAFVENFTGQWLDLRAIDATTPDKRLYPEYDELLKLSMVDETEAFFAELLNKNLPVSNLIQSDFAMLNSRLATHYGIEGVSGEEFRRVALKPDSGRGGILTQASICKVTANGTTTSPVLRGAWVMKRLLGQTPPPPPANVGSIEPDTRGATTIREQLAKHRTSEACAGCHAKIDPPGFALESFDVIGGFRDRYRSQDKGDRVDKHTPGGRYYRVLLGPAVDASGELADGRKFAGIADFKTLLLGQQDQVMHALASNLVIYSTGAGISYGDRREIAAIVAKTKQQGGGLRTLIEEIVSSPLFQNK
jgi:mono/diheme cytochrome c family protein